MICQNCGVDCGCPCPLKFKWPTPDGRAATLDQKRAMLDNVLAVWLQHPQLRLGQLLVNAHQGATGISDIYHVEDDELVRLLERYES